MQHPSTAKDRTGVYWVWDGEDRLIYVGMGLNPITRLTAHMDKAWWKTVARVDIRWYPNRIEAEKVEQEAIRTQHPMYNVVCAVREMPSPEPIIVSREKAQSSLNRTGAARKLGLTEDVLKKCAERGWLIPYFRISPGATRGQHLYSDEALEEFKRRWEAGEYNVTPPAPRERSA